MLHRCDMHMHKIVLNVAKDSNKLGLTYIPEAGDCENNAWHSQGIKCEASLN